MASSTKSPIFNKFSCNSVKPSSKIRLATIISPLHLSITFVVEQFNHVCFSKFIPDLFTRLSVPCFVSVISLDYYGGKMKLRISLIHPPMCKVLTHLLFPLSETAGNIILCLLFLWISKNDIRFIEFYDFTI